MRRWLLGILSVLFIISGCRQASLMECPHYSKRDCVVSHKAYTLCYNSISNTSDWVAYELTREETLGEWPRTNDFRPDPDVPESQVENTDYKGSGWHRGHLAPAGDMKWDSTAMSESFFFTNICPQHHDLNQGVWQQLENKVRKWAVEYGTIYVCCGPIYSSDSLPHRLGASEVWIPDYYYKALLVPTGESYSAIAFIMRNGAGYQDLSTCACTIDMLEEILGLNLFCSLKNAIEKEIEATIRWEDWGLNKPVN